jgi:6-phosphogluconolactonase
MSEPLLHVLDDPTDAVGRLLADQAHTGGAIVLTGGTSIGPAYAHAAVYEPNWRRVSLWWGDERCVPPSDERSNYRLARLTLLDRLAGNPEVHRIRGEISAAEAAESYEHELGDRPLDLLLLGLGDDGHIASLFPGSPQLQERATRVTYGAATLPPFVERVTLTLPTLLAARRIVLLAVGDGKAEALERALAQPIDEATPASLLRAAEAPLEVFSDHEAAKLLAA